MTALEIYCWKTIQPKFSITVNFNISISKHKQRCAFIHERIYRTKSPEGLNCIMKSLYLQQTSSGIKNYHWNSTVKGKKKVLWLKKEQGEKKIAGAEGGRKKPQRLSKSVVITNYIKAFQNSSLTNPTTLSFS